ncbi:FIG00452466: hypothetical protein [Caballeronia glathei]|uniref:DUF1857 domain-containing protein n=1 Tax=Caballeronia glathei TaxID=60547 RepID=A0A069PK23_9BURK|nr:SRPBCC family protein [Caballeronia glathei]KDR41073.1 hypothetical protein BG61_21350 [Caballeronia glathei]CDY73298.1 FIG00452466: hypothetical protein [Caballeronia glathei]
MNFEHLIQINDPLNPFVDTLTREQLWDGLVLRAEQPQLFVLGLDSCTILSRDGDRMERELHYGQAVVRDRVTLTPGASVRYDILPTADHVGGSLTMAIEQPDELQLFLRFTYSTTLPVADEANASPDVLQTQEIVKSAYREADIDTVRLIRQYVHGPKGQAPLH